MTNFWNICDNDAEYKNMFLKDILNIVPSNNYYQLNTNKKLFSFLEIIVYNIINFHCDRLNIGKKYIEFGFVEKNNYFVKKNKPNPILSIVVFLENNQNPLLISNLIEDTYKYKEFNDIKISCFFPKIFKHIIFEPNNNYYSLLNEKTLIINIWEKFQSNSIPFPEKIFSPEHYSEIDFENIDCHWIFKENESKNVFFQETENEFNYDYFDEFIYLDSSKYKELTNLIQQDENEKYDSFEFKQSVNLQNIINKNENRIEIDIPKFIQRFIKKKVYKSDVCNWIIKESENYAINNGGWNTKRHKIYPTTDLPLNKIVNIYSFVLNSFEDIIQFVKNSYCLDKNYIFHINDIFIVKYDSNGQSNLELHSDESDLSINILLSNPDDFEGGGTYFEDGITTCLERGDALIHCGKTKHSGLKITKGNRYLLVAFIKIFEKNIL